MAHEKVYGICENKCRVEVYPKTDVYNKDEVYTKSEVNVVMNNVYTKGNFAIVEVAAEISSTSATADLPLALPTGFTRDNCFLVGLTHLLGNDTSYPFTYFNDIAPVNSGINSGVIIGNFNGSGFEISINRDNVTYHKVRLLFMKV